VRVHCRNWLADTHMPDSIGVRRHVRGSELDGRVESLQPEEAWPIRRPGVLPDRQPFERSREGGLIDHENAGRFHECPPEELRIHPLVIVARAP
jgi:hypothetical protein